MKTTTNSLLTITDLTNNHITIQKLEDKEVFIRNISTLKYFKEFKFYEILLIYTTKSQNLHSSKKLIWSNKNNKLFILCQYLKEKHKTYAKKGQSIEEYLRTINANLILNSFKVLKTNKIYFKTPEESISEVIHGIQAYELLSKHLNS